MVAKRAVEKASRMSCSTGGSYRYHGRIKALGDAARESGLKLLNG